MVHVDEHHRERRPVPAMPLHLAALDFVEEAAVVAAGQRIGDRQAPDFFVGAGETTIGQAKLVGHVLEDEDVHAQCDEERGDDGERGQVGSVTSAEVEDERHQRWPGDDSWR